jgi:polyisoprenoid-binding protein YceI
MRKSLCGVGLTSFLLSVILGVAAPARVAADDYVLDEMHTAATFKIAHIGLSWTYGRFNDVAGAFTLDPADATKASFTLSIKAESLDTNNKKRDDHLRSPDFFNVKQFPGIGFKSTSVKAVKDGFEVTGDLTLHGVTGSITFPLKGGAKAEFPKGVQRTGFSTELVLKRSEFGMDKMVGPVGDDVYVSISFEGVKK